MDKILHIENTDFYDCLFCRLLSSLHTRQVRSFTSNRCERRPVAAAAAADADELSPQGGRMVLISSFWGCLIYSRRLRDSVSGV